MGSRRTARRTDHSDSSAALTPLLCPPYVGVVSCVSTPGRETAYGEWECRPPGGGAAFPGWPRCYATGMAGSVGATGVAPAMSQVALSDACRYGCSRL